MYLDFFLNPNSFGVNTDSFLNAMNIGKKMKPALWVDGKRHMKALMNFNNNQL